MAQRLVRKSVRQLPDRVRADLEQIMELNLRPDDVKGRSSTTARAAILQQHGYRGRQGLYEIMLLDDDMRMQIVQHASTQVLRAEAKSGECGPFAIAV